MTYHKKAGLPHAEIEAMYGLTKEQLKDSTLYVTLEPCSHSDKRTPPCTEAILDSSIACVVCAMEDPNPMVKGIETLRCAGITVDVGVCKDAARELNKAYSKWITTGLPCVTLKAAMSLDGKIATRKGESKWISSAESRRIGHRMRSLHDAILVGIGTVLNDNPRLDCRLVRGKDPIKVIVDSRLRIPLNAEILKKNGVIIACGKMFDKRKKKRLEAFGIEFIICDDGHGSVALRKLMGELAKKGVTSVLLEGGGELNESMLKEGLIDRLSIFIAPKIIGGQMAKGLFNGKGIERLGDAIPVKNVSVRMVEPDLLLEAVVDNKG